MRKRTKTPWPSLSALWSLFWRAVLLTPFALIVGVIWLMLILLPFCEIIYLINHDWLWASVLPPIWLGLFFLVRSKRFKADRRDFPNEQENI